MSKYKGTFAEATPYLKLIIGEGYYKAVKEKSSEMSVNGIKVILWLYCSVLYPSLTFKPYSLNFRVIFTSEAFSYALRELVQLGYINRVKRGFYAFDAKGDSFIHGFWITHGNIVKRLTAVKQ